MHGETVEADSKSCMCRFETAVLGQSFQYICVMSVYVKKLLKGDLFWAVVDIFTIGGGAKTS